MRFFLIGGKTDKNGTILEEVLLSKVLKDTPNILYFPNASNDYIDSLNRFKEQMKNLKYNVKMYVYENYKEDIIWADILYFGGGITQKIVADLLDLKNEIIESNKVIAGSSAGANMWFKAGMGDFYSFVDNFHTYNYKMIDGYNVINATFCPHYQNEDLIVYNDVVKRYDCNGYAVENDTAIWIENDRLQVYKQDKSKSVYLFDKEKKYQMIPLYEGKIYKME